MVKQNCPRKHIFRSWKNRIVLENIFLQLVKAELSQKTYYYNLLKKNCPRKQFVMQREEEGKIKRNFDSPVLKVKAKITSSKKYYLFLFLYCKVIPTGFPPKRLNLSRHFRIFRENIWFRQKFHSFLNFFGSSKIENFCSFRFNLFREKCQNFAKNFC